MDITTALHAFQIGLSSPLLRAQFALRDAVFYQAPASKTTDCFVVLCTITNVAGPPVPPPAVPRQAVPRDVIDRLGSLLDDPRFSDVEFILPTPGQPIQSAKRIYAASKLLRRVDYFDIMFSSGFRESETLSIGATAASEPSAAESMSSNLDDSDAEDEDDSMSTIEDDNELDFDDSHPGLASAGAAASLTTGSTPPRENEETEEPGSDAEGCRNVRPKLSHPSSPRTRTPMVAHERDRSTTSSARGPHKMQVVIKDASYWTYRAVLYYVRLLRLYWEIVAHRWHRSTLTASSLHPCHLPSSLLWCKSRQRRRRR